MPVEFTPPRIAVVIDKKTFTRELVMAAGGFALCVPGAVLADATFAVGSVSGRDVPDKLARFGLSAQPGPVLGMPVIEEGCCAWMECRLIPERHTEEAYDTCFAEVLAAAADERVFRNGRWSFSDTHVDLHTLHHLGAGAFAVAGGVVQARHLV
jgi:flavin reductase (DIM6/NTAB) family NADH-FMN oxidoreductase RutF